MVAETREYQMGNHTDQEYIDRLAAIEQDVPDMTVFSGREEFLENSSIDEADIDSSRGFD